MEPIQWIQSFSTPFLDRFFALVSVLGEETIYIVLLGLIFWCVDKRYGYKLAFAFLFSSVVNGVAKDIFKVQRPIGMEGIRNPGAELPTSYSFPSGNMQNITSFSVSLMRQYRLPWLYAVGGFLILLTGVARLYMGVHWPFDVLGGIFFGVACTYAADFLMEAAERKNRRHMHLLAIPPVLLVTFLWRNSPDLVKAAGIFCSFLADCSIEGQWIRFETKAVFWKQAVKLALGLGGVLLFKSLLKSLLPEAPVYEFLRYFVMGIWITVGAPALFGWLRLKPSVPKAAAQTIACE